MAELKVTRLVAASPERAFDAWLDPKLARRFLFATPTGEMVRADIDARVGGKYRYEWKAPSGYVMGMGGVVTAIEPVSHVASAELFDDDWTGGETVSALNFDEASGRTTLVNTITYASKDARDGALKTPMAEGMEFGYSKLDDVLAELKQE